MKSLNLDVGEFGAYFEQRHLQLGLVVEEPWNNAGFTSVLNDPAFAGRMRQFLESELELARAYFDPIFSGRNRIGIVEIGWQGSIQDSLAIMYPGKEFHGFFLGLARYKNPPVANSQKTSFGPDRNRSDDHRKLLDAVNVMEFLSLTPGGSVASYRRLSSGEVAALRISEPTEESLISQFSVPFQRGVIEQCAIEVAREGMQGLKTEAFRSEALDVWARLLSDPHPELVRAYFALKSNEEFGLGEFRDQSHTPSWSTIALAPFCKSRRAQLIGYLTYSQWAEGIRSRRDLPLLKRWVLYVLMCIAIRAKPMIQDRRLRRTKT